MKSKTIRLLDIERGLVTAPAGCGKTHLIAQSVAQHQASKPVLILTHTNAGVAALRNRLNRLEISRKSYRLSTVDGMAIRLVSSFPKRRGIGIDTLKLLNPKADYPRIRQAACALLKDGTFLEILRANYSNLIVDEYQDCSILQHTLITAIATAIPTCILGDPLQAVFTFQPLPKWTDVCSLFPFVQELDVPWRWKIAGTEEFGHWLLDIRTKFLARVPIDFSIAPKEVTLFLLDNLNTCFDCQVAAAQLKPPTPDSTILIIGAGTSPPQHRKFAKRIYGAVTVESVDLRDLTNFAKQFDFTAQDAVNRLIDFASNIMTNVDAQNFHRRIISLEKNTATRAPSIPETIALQFIKEPTPSNAAELLVSLNKEQDVKCHRPEIFRACVRSLNACSLEKSISFHDAAIATRESNRLHGRSLPKKAVGSTLLLKGLESDVSVILNTHEHNFSSLYVAMTRGSKRLIVCSPMTTWNEYRAF